MSKQQSESQATAKHVDLSGMSAAELGERVADCARTHGAQCAEIRRADTTPAWRRFREAAHHDPALAHVEAERCVARGDDAGARMWRWVARNAERRTCS